MGTVSQLLLTITTHLGVFVVEEMIFEGCTEIRGKLVTCCDREQGWHVVASANAILIRSNVGAETTTHLLLDAIADGDSLFSRDGTCHHEIRQRFLNQTGRVEFGLQHVCVVFGVQFGAELITGRQREGSLMVVQTDDRREAPALLVNIEQEFCQCAFRAVVGDDMTTIVTIVVVGAYTNGC